MSFAAVIGMLVLAFVVGCASSPQVPQRPAVMIESPVVLPPAPELVVVPPVPASVAASSATSPAPRPVPAPAQKPVPRSVAAAGTTSPAIPS